MSALMIILQRVEFGPLQVNSLSSLNVLSSSTAEVQLGLFSASNTYEISKDKNLIIDSGKLSTLFRVLPCGGSAMWVHYL